MSHGVKQESACGSTEAPNINRREDNENNEHRSS